MPQYKLSQLLEIADRGFKTLFAGFDFWGTAEVVKVTVKGKYAYLELVEYDEDGTIIAKVKGCIFDEGVCKKFLQETKLKSLNEIFGLKILFHGRFSFHKEYHFSIIIDELSSEFTLGQLQKKQDDILQELLKIGIAYNNKQTVRGYPSYTIAVISAAGAAGLKDFQAVLEQSDYNVNYENYFCAMHGNNAIEAVYEQLQLISGHMKDGKKIDTVAIIRGGGESSGIIRQNDLNIAKSICLMPVPVMVAIGHTQDRFVLQDLARYGAKTPTDAAYKLIEVLDQWDEHVDIVYDAILTISAEKIYTMRESMDQRYADIRQKLKHVLEYARLHVDGRYRTIMAISPTKMLQSGYALLSLNGEYLTKEEISGLQAGDNLTIQVYDQEFNITINSKK